MHAVSILLLTSVLAIGLTTCTPHGPIHKHGTWTYLDPIPHHPRQEHATVAVSSTTLYVLGGIVDYLANQTTDPTTALVQSYSIPNNSWRSAASLPMPINHANAAVVNGKIYVLGALAPDPDWYWRAVPDCWVYTPEEDAWEVLPPMPASLARGSAAVGVHGTTIYLAGGQLLLDVFHNVLSTVDTVSAYDTATGSWTLLPAAARSLPAPRDHAGAAVVGDTFYVLGGRAFSQANVSNAVFALDLCNMERGWRTREATMPTARGGVSTGVVGDKVYIFGGEGNAADGSKGLFNQTEAYDTVMDSWERLMPMEVPRHGTSAVGVRERIYIPGGGILQSGAPVATFDSFQS